MDTTQGFGRFLDRTLKKITQTYLHSFKKNGINLTMEQWVVLQQIYLVGENASQSNITKNAYRNRATTSRVIGGLSKKGLLTKERFEGNFKQYKLVLTEKGKEIIEKALPLSKELRLVGYQNVSEADFGVFLRVLEQLWENYDGYEGE